MIRALEIEAPPFALRMPGRAPLLVAMACALWAGVDTGPWALEGSPATGIEWVHYARTLLPLVVLAASALYLLGRSALGGAVESGSSSLPASVSCLIVYGVLAAVGGAMSARPAWAAYWAAAYFGVFLALIAALRALRDEPHERAARICNQVTWLIAAAVLAVLVLVSGRGLLVHTREGLSGYGVVNRVGAVGGVLVSRASGFSRFAAIPCVVGFAWFLRTRGALRWTLGVVVVASAALVYWMQSRGATVGTAGALLFVALLAGRRIRLGLAVMALALVIAVLGEWVSAQAVQRVEEQLSRGQHARELGSLTGRTQTWEAAWGSLQEDPLIGRGFQADRSILHAHVHNALLYAWLAAGLPGLLAFAAGFVVAWRDLLRVVRARAPNASVLDATTLACGGLLVFFSARLIPEASGAVFGVDLLVLVPAMTYLGVRARSARADPHA